MKLGVICDGISRDLLHAVDVINGNGTGPARVQALEHGQHETAAER